MSRAPAAAAAHGARGTLTLRHAALPRRGPGAPARRRHQAGARSSWTRQCCHPQTPATVQFMQSVRWRKHDIALELGLCRVSLI